MRRCDAHLDPFGSLGTPPNYDLGMTAVTRPNEKRYPLSGSVRAAIAVGIVVVAGLTGVIAYAIAAKDCDYSAVNACIEAATNDLARFQCKSASCTSSSPWFWGIAGALLGVVGASVLAVLLARSFGEWQMQRAAQHAGAERLRRGSERASGQESGRGSDAGNS